MEVRHEAAPENKRKFVVAVVLCLPWDGIWHGQRASAERRAQTLREFSFVQGSVQLLAGQGTDFQQAVINMPVLDGSRLQAGGDGQAEVEFGDGSVARLTPNSGDHSSITWVRIRFSSSRLPVWAITSSTWVRGIPFHLAIRWDIRGI